MRHPNTPRRRGIRTIIAISAIGVASALALAVPALACTLPNPGGHRTVHPVQPGTCKWGSCAKSPTCAPGRCGNVVQPPTCGNGCTPTKPPACGNGCTPGAPKPPTCANGCTPGAPNPPTCANGCGGSSGSGSSGGGSTVPPSTGTSAPPASFTQPAPGTPPGGNGGGGSLPVTGVNLVAVTSTGGGLLVAGLGVFYLARRRRVRFTA